MSRGLGDIADVLRELAPAESLLSAASRVVRPLSAATPENLIEERARLTRALACGSRAVPAWRYAAPPTETRRLRPLLENLANALEARAEPIPRLYADRARELALECAMCETVGTFAFSDLARQRFEDVEDRGLAFARARLAEPEVRELATGEGSLRTDDPSPLSLLSRLREELGRRRLPFAVRVVRGLSALAATGDRHVLVAEGRIASADDVERTVLHEVQGHVIPRVRALTEALGLFRFGTARGTCDQEGYALVLEERAGFLERARTRELSARRIAVELAREGADYEETARTLIGVHALGVEDGARITERAFRGGDGAHAGLVRDRPYLGAWLRLREAFSGLSGPEVEDMVSRGQVSLAAALVLVKVVPASV